ncbi:MAG: urea ABC transporter permease subunit UrtB [Pseudomonadota bacterium]
MFRVLAVLWLALCGSFVQALSLQEVLQANQAAVEKASRKTVDAVLSDLVTAAAPGTQTFIEKWADRDVWMRKEDKLFFFVETDDKKTYTLLDIETGAPISEAQKRDLKQLKPNSGVRSVLASYLVQFKLMDPEPRRRAQALQSIERDPDESHYAPLKASIEAEDYPALKERKERLVRLLAIRFEPDEATRIAAIESFRGNLSVEARAALNPIVQTQTVFGVPENANIARILRYDQGDIDQTTALRLASAAGAIMPQPSLPERKAALEANIVDGVVGGVPLHQLDTQAARDAAYEALAKAGAVPDWQAAQSEQDALAEMEFAVVYTEPSAAVTEAAEATLASINQSVGLYQALDLGLDALSLASIFFLAAIGLAITFGVMGVINMAHGEFIMMGAYTGYVVQLFVPNYTASLLIALPLAFAVTFGAGVAMERLVIRWLYDRPLETLLATFGISIALQQIAKNIFGTQARPLTAPGWLDGAWVMNDIVSISYIRIAIFVLGVVFFCLLLFILKRTRLGLEVRAVTQNPRMASSMGINPDRINMLTFGIGSGIAGIAGVAIGLYAKVTSEMGSDYIVQSFMTVVVGGVGNIWGTLLGAGLIGSLQKGIEWLNPSNTLAAQTYMILFVILFIQFRPRGIIALKGRAAGD